MLCEPLKVNRRLGGTSRLHLHGRIMRSARNQREIRLPPAFNAGLLVHGVISQQMATCFHVGFLLGFFFDLGGGGNMFLRNLG
jgi:hypothetical protein